MMVQSFGLVVQQKCKLNRWKDKQLEQVMKPVEQRLKQHELKSFSIAYSSRKICVKLKTQVVGEKQYD